MTVLRYGIEMNEWAAEWFERAARDLEREIAGERETGRAVARPRMTPTRR